MIVDAIVDAFGDHVRDASLRTSRPRTRRGALCSRAVSAHWIATANELEHVLDRLLRVDRYALDTEFLRERTYHPQLALLQLAWNDADGTHVALVDPLAVDVAPLRAVLGSDALAVVHAAAQDLAIVERACGVTPRRLFDPQVAASFLGFDQASLGALCEAWLGARLPKGDQLTDWTRRPLHDDARDYAAGDVLHLLDLHEKLARGFIRPTIVNWRVVKWLWKSRTQLLADTFDRLLFDGVTLDKLPEAAGEVGWAAEFRCLELLGSTYEGVDQKRGQFFHIDWPDSNRPQIEA